ncbi:unnamed protein product, partial [Prunus brigantina]
MWKLSIFFLPYKQQQVEATHTIKRSLFYIFNCYAAALIVVRKESWRRR